MRAVKEWSNPCEGRDPRSESNVCDKTCCSFLGDVLQFHSNRFATQLESEAVEQASEIRLKVMVPARTASTRIVSSSVVHLEWVVIFLEREEWGGIRTRSYGCAVLYQPYRLISRDRKRGLIVSQKQECGCLLGFTTSKYHRTCQRNTRHRHLALPNVKNGDQKRNSIRPLPALGCDVTPDALIPAVSVPRTLER